MDALRHPLVAPLIPALQDHPAVAAAWLTGALAQGRGDLLSSPHIHLLWTAPHQDPGQELPTCLERAFPGGWTPLDPDVRALDLLLHPDPDHPERDGGRVTLRWTMPEELPDHLAAHGPRRELFRIPARMSPALVQVLDRVQSAPYPTPTAAQVRHAMLHFWAVLSALAGACSRGDHLAAAQLLCQARRHILELVSALNGSGPPPTPARVRPFLGPDQTHALTRTLAQPRGIHRASWIGQAVALVVIYRWYAPQLATRFSLDLPRPVETAVLQRLARSVPGWPARIETP